MADCCEHRDGQGSPCGDPMPCDAPGHAPRKQSSFEDRVRDISGLDEATLKRLGGIGSEQQFKPSRGNHPITAHAIDKQLNEHSADYKRLARPCDDDAPCGRGGCVACIPDRIEQTCPRTGDPCDICNENGRAACAETHTETVKREHNNNAVITASPDISRYCIECERLSTEVQRLHTVLAVVSMAAFDHECGLEGYEDKCPECHAVKALHAYEESQR